MPEKIYMKGKAPKKKGINTPIIVKRNIVRHGNTLRIAIPPEWVERHGLIPGHRGDEVVLIANDDIRITVDPKKIKEVDDAISPVVKEPV